MKNAVLVRAGLFILFLSFIGIGCDRSVPPPSPLALEEIPAVFTKAFAKAKPDAKELSAQVVALVQAQDYTKAFFELQNLAAKQSLTKEQSSVTTRASLTVNSLLQAAQAKGDAQAAQAVKFYHDNK